MGGRLLLVEDDPDQREMLATMLRSHGHDVFETSSAELALEQLLERPFDLVLTDYRLSGATGTWLARVAPRRSDDSPVKVLLITAHQDLRDADGLPIVTKPVDEKTLVAAIENLLAASPISHPAGPPLPTGPTQRVALTLYVSDSLRSVNASNNLRSILSTYRLDQIAVTVVKVSGSREALAEKDRIVATPTLLKTFPAPRVWIVGDLAERGPLDRVLEHAGVEHAGVEHAGVEQEN